MSIWVGNSDSTGDSTGAIAFETAIGLEAGKLRVSSGDNHALAEDLNHSSAIRVGEADRVLVKVSKSTKVSKYNAVTESWSNEVISEGLTTVLVDGNRVFTFTSEAAGSSIVRILDRTSSSGAVVSAASMGARVDALPIGTTGSAAGKLTGHLLPDANAAYDFGSAEYKIRHLFLSDNSLWVGDNHKISISDGKMKFRKRKASWPSSGHPAGSDAGAESHSGKPVDAMSYVEMLEYMKTLPGNLADGRPYSEAIIDDLYVEDGDFDRSDDFETSPIKYIESIADTVPGGASEGDAWLVSGSPGGAFAGRGGELAVADGAGNIVFTQAEAGHVVYLPNDGSGNPVLLVCIDGDNVAAGPASWMKTVLVNI